MRRFPLLLLLGFAACGDPTLRGSTGDLRFSPSDEVVFPSTPVGGSTVREVHLVNTGRNAVALHLNSSAPFSVEAPSELPGGAEAQVRIHFDPTDKGEFRGAVTLSANSSGPELPLRGTSREACPAALCSTAFVNEETGACIVIPAADGTRCSTACAADGQCKEGRCIGESIDCNDGDLCTVDGCDPSRGCVHSPFTCDAPTDPCLAPLCDPVQGCLTTPVADGTRCGESDCVTASVCLQGVCMQKPVPDGAECGEPSPCQPSGVCHNQVCERPAAVTLEPTWIWSLGTGRFVSPHPAMDRSGTLYFRYVTFVVGSAGDAELLAVRRDGSAYPLVEAFEEDTPVVLDGILIGKSGSHVRAVDATTGAKLWDQDVEVLIRQSSHALKSTVVLGSVMSPRPGEVLLSASSLPDDRSWTVSLDAQTGAIEQLDEHPVYAPFDAFSDGSGITFFSVTSGAGVPIHSIRAENSAGSALWTALDLDVVRSMVWNGRLITAGYRSDASCGYALEGWNPFNGTEEFRRADVDVMGDRYAHLAHLRAAGGAFFAVASVDPDSTCHAVGPELMRFDPVSGSTRWSLPLGSSDGIYGELLPTDANSLLFSDWLPSERHMVLRNVGVDGKERWQCALPPQTMGLVGLHQGRAFFETSSGLSAIDLPGLDLAAHGWVNEYGDPEHRRRPH